MWTALKRMTVAATAVALLASCGSAPPDSSADRVAGDTAPAGVSAQAVSVIDVRTPAEYSAGHLDGARLLDFNSGEFAAAIPTLDPDATYYLYCRSGNRAGQAAALLSSAGFGEVVNLGSLQQAADTTGAAIVRG